MGAKLPPPAARYLAATSPSRGEVREITSPREGEVATSEALWRVGGEYQPFPGRGTHCPLMQDDSLPKCGS